MESLSAVDGMKHFFKKTAVIIVPPLLYVIMRFIWYTNKKTFHFITPVSKAQHVCVCWHGELLMSPQAYRKIRSHTKASAIVSSHFDGTLLARTLNFLKIRPLYGSSKKGARQVLIKAFKSIKSGEEILITPDGPRGPRHSMSDGASGIALKSKLPLFLVNYKASSYWQLKSWDRFVIPKPFGRIDFYLQSLSVNGMELEEAKKYLQKKMLEHTID